MEKIWFIFNAGEVLGPFSTEEISQGIMKSQWTTESLVWWKGQNEWIAVTKWKEQLPKILDARNRKSNSVWYLEKSGQKLGPISKTDLIGFLRNVNGVADINLWSEQSCEWRPVYSYAEVVKELGFFLRTTPRAQIVGEVSVEGFKDKFQMNIIGEGGCGVAGGQALQNGTIYKIHIQSPVLVSAIRADASVRYISSQGGVGFRFETISAEARSVIVDYVKQYKDPVDEDQTSVTTPTSQWYVNRDGLQHGPISRSELITLLQWIENRANINLWTEGMNHWTNVFEFNEILDEIGISRRASKRAPILGQVALQKDGVQLVIDAVSISESGLGIKAPGQALELGSTMSGTLTATAFDHGISFKAQVMYTEDSGYGGLRFLNIAQTDLAILKTYIEKFSDSKQASPEVKKAA